jgi:hypothetical protein
MLNRVRSNLLPVMLTLGACAACAVDVPDGNAPSSAGAAASVAIASMDAERNVPTMVWAGRGGSLPRPAHTTPEAAARGYLARHASLYRLSQASLEAAYVHRVHDIGRGGVIVIFRQRVAGLEVAHTELKVLMTRNLELVALTGGLHDGVDRALAEAGGQDARAAFRHPSAKAVTSALGDMYGVSLTGSDGELTGISLVTPARVVPVYFPVGGRLVPAYSIELLAERAGDGQRQGYEYVTDARDGSILHRQNRISNDRYSYQVWADADGTPRDGPQADYTPHPTGVPDGTEPAFVLSTRMEVEGLVHPDGTVDPWLPSGATHTSGNNVHAYADHHDPDGFTAGLDTQPSVLPDTRQFHDVYDTSAGPLASETQAHAASVQLFYTTNWLHDYFYTSGFDEPAGNAQDNNHGRGGVGGDALLAEAQNLGPDAQARNNALIYTPSDGTPPRMEMYLWEMPEDRSVTVSGTRYDTGKAAFGAQDFAMTGSLLLADDGVASRSDGCQPLQNAVTGALVLADRGQCLYEQKAVNAENAGAAGLIIINHVPGDPPPDMFDVDSSLHATIPVLSISYEDGQALKQLLATGALEGTMARTPSIERDGTIDNTIIAHEWGHLLHYRLVECSTAQCRAQSEGWGDFIALHMMVREGDNLDGTYGIASYASHILGESAYYGIRRAPYSRNPAKNALRFRHISHGEPLPGHHPLRDRGVANSEIHNAGEIWASMLFDGYLALLEDARGISPRIASFAEARRRMADYVVAGMVLAPANPTFTEQRDALLMAALARDPQDMLLLAQAFAGRGAGTCAVAPPRDSTNLRGVEEDQALHPDMRFEVVQMNDGLRSCDGDGVLDAEEAGSIEIKVTNAGPVALTGAVLQVSASAASLSFPQGTSFEIAEVTPFSSGTVRIPFELAPSLTAPSEVDIDLVLSNSQACQTSVMQRRMVKFNYTLVPSRVDTVEGHQPAWHARVLEGGAGQAWKIVRSPLNDREHVWYAEDGYDFADTVLETPLLQLAASEKFLVTFEHRYSFAHQLDPLTRVMNYWNGGVIEVSRDNGETWEDVRLYTEPGYGGMVAADTGNNLSGRQAYVAQSPSWPGMNALTLDFGTGLGGGAVKLRFRLGSAWVFEDHGWEIDNISLQGVANQPFMDVGNDTGSCLPIADAGGDQAVSSGDEVGFDGSRSSDPHGDALTFSWLQTAGPAVALQGGDTALPRFTAPPVEGEALLSFELRVTDGTFTSSDSVNVLVRPLPQVGEPPVSEGGGCGCLAAGSVQDRSWMLWLSLFVGALATARRGSRERSHIRGGRSLSGR